MKKSMLIVAVTLTTYSLLALADPNIAFMVSGVLRSKEDGNVIKLVQGYKSAVSAKEAASAFTNEALKQYPQYSMLDVIASPLATQPTSCNKFTAI